MKKPATPASLRDLCLTHFKILGIPIAPNDLDTMLERADKETLSHLMFLDLLLGQQAAARRERSVEYRIREARFEEPKTLETFDWKFNPQIDRLQMEELASGDFIRRQSNLIVVGQAGVGKSHLIQAIGMRACALGYRVLYSTHRPAFLPISPHLWPIKPYRCGCADISAPNSWSLMSSPSIASNASNPLKPLICSIRSSSLATIAAPRLSSPISILTAGPITWAMDLWPWLYSTVLLKAQSLSRSREDPIEHGKLKPVSLLQRIKARLNSTELRFGCGHTLPRRIP